MSDARDALREQFNKWCDSQTGFLFSPGAKSSDFFYEIWLAGRDARAQAEGGTVPSTSCPKCGCPEGSFHYDGCPDASTGTHMLKRVHAAPSASEGKPTTGGVVRADPHFAPGSSGDALPYAAAPDAELIAAREYLSQFTHFDDIVAAFARLRMGQPAITDAEVAKDKP